MGRFKITYSHLATSFEIVEAENEEQASAYAGGSSELLEIVEEGSLKIIESIGFEVEEED